MTDRMSPDQIVALNARIIKGETVPREELRLAIHTMVGDRLTAMAVDQPKKGTSKKIPLADLDDLLK